MITTSIGPFIIGFCCFEIQCSTTTRFNDNSDKREREREREHTRFDVGAFICSRRGARSDVGAAHRRASGRNVNIDKDNNDNCNPIKVCSSYELVASNNR